MNDRKHQILKKRAEALSTVLHQNEIDAESIEILNFTLSQEKYSIETKYIKEVYPLKEYTILPGTPSFIFGVFNLRRKIVTIIDLKALFSLPIAKSSKWKVIVLKNDDKELAVLTDGIGEIRKLQLSELENSLPTFDDIKMELLKGISADGTVVLDAKAILTSKRLVIDDTMEM